MKTKPQSTKYKDAVSMYNSGMSIGNCAEVYSISRQAMHDVLRRRDCVFRSNCIGEDNAFFIGSKGNLTKKKRCQGMVERAVKKGILKRPDNCSECNEGFSYKDGRAGIQGHHCDYDKPLEVIWLCKKCHHNWHQNNTPLNEIDKEEKLKLMILTRPLANFDSETTGTNVVTDRIVSLCIIKEFPDGRKETKRTLVNPCMPIPAAATAVHGITDEMVITAPTFSQIAKSIYGYLSDSDLAGFNIIQFDVPILSEEFARCGIDFPIAGQLFIDSCAIFKKYEERTLSAAHKFYLNSEMEDAHNAEADTQASINILKAQIERYEDLSLHPHELAEFCKWDNRIDLAGKFVKDADLGDYSFNFGKHKGESVANVFRTTDPGYYKWMMGGEFTMNTKKVATKLFEWVNSYKKAK